MNESEIKEHKKSNDEFRFLYRSCKGLKPVIITNIANIPEFMDVLRQHSGDVFNEEHLYNILKPIAYKMIVEHRTSKLVRSTMNRISKAVTGDVNSWKNE